MKKMKMNNKILYMVILFLVVMLASAGTVFAERIISAGIVTYDNKTSKLNSTNVQGAVDELYNRQARYAQCEKNSYGSLACYLLYLKGSNTVITDDGTAGHNMRYIGSNPNNWVSFNGELWRIVGVFGTDSHGQSNKLVKIQYSGTLGAMRWIDNDINDWENSTLKTYLNSGDYYTKTLNSDAKKLIQAVKWKLGAAPWVQETMYANVFYNYERGSIGAKSNPTSLEWSGNVAMSYPSDYIFSTNGGRTHSREECLKIQARNVDNTVNELWRADDEAGECVTGSWMIQQVRSLKMNTWTLMPLSDYTNRIYHVRYTLSYGPIVGILSNVVIGVTPAVYLKSDVVCKNCSDSTAGTQNNPFQIA